MEEGAHLSVLSKTYLSHMFLLENPIKHQVKGCSQPLTETFLDGKNSISTFSKDKRQKVVNVK